MIMYVNTNNILPQLLATSDQCLPHLSSLVASLRPIPQSSRSTLTIHSQSACDQHALTGIVFYYGTLVSYELKAVVIADWYGENNRWQSM